MERNPVRYGAVSQALHWLTAILVLAAFILGPEGGEEHARAAGVDPQQQLHETFGLAVFALVLLRVLWRLVARQPDPVPVARWMGIVAKSVQGLLYLLMFALPLTGVVGTWLEGHPLTLAGGAEIGPLLALNHDLGEGVSEVHEFLGDAIMWLAGLHAIAALYHHFILRDSVLVSMLPRWVKPRPAR